VLIAEGNELVRRGISSSYQATRSWRSAGEDSNSSETPTNRLLPRYPDAFATAVGSAAVPCRRKVNATAFRQWRSLVAGGGFEPPTFGLCDLTHLSMRVGLYLHPRGMLAIQSLRLPPPFRGLGSVLPYRSRDVGSTDFDE
jgi:hypothetical protein